MNYYLKFSFSLLLIAFVFSCNDRDKVADNTAENVIKINDLELNKRYLASDVFESYTLIPLETNDDCLIGKCSKIIITDSIIHVFDDQSQSVYLFGMDGKYKTKIHNMGQGSNQYTEIYDFTLMKNGDLLILNFRKLIRLKNDGTPYKTYSLPFTSDAVENMDDTMMVFNGARFDDRVIIWDIIREKRINSYIKYDVKRSVRIFKPLIKYGDKIYFSRCYSSILYNVTQKELEKNG
jgi:hypothetical protein